MAIGLQQVAGGVAVHLIRYDDDDAQDKVPPRSKLTIDIRLPAASASASIVAPVGSPTAALTQNGEWHTLQLRDVPIYSVVVLERG